jgi:putative hydrolase of the HAD superfamily
VTDSLHNLRAILFDFGGTLDGPGEPWIERFALAYRAAGLDVTPDCLHDAVGYGTREGYRAPRVARFGLHDTVAFHVACQFEHLRIRNDRAAATIVNTFVTRTAAALVDSHVLLARLAARFRLGVVSNFYGNVERILVECRIAPLLGTIIDSTVVGVSKPDPDIFALAVKRLGVCEDVTLFVGDSIEQDIKPARAAGLRTAWLVGARTDFVAADADLCLRSLGELDALLDSSNSTH